MEYPDREGAWNRRGLVWEVSNWKTGNYTAFDAKAIDAGTNLL